MNRFAKYLPLSAVLFLTAMTHAQKPALVQNTDERGRVPFQQQAVVTCEAAASYCSAAMLVPTGQRLVVTHVNAVLYTIYSTSSAGTFGTLTTSPLPAGYGSGTPGLTFSTSVATVFPTTRLGTNAFGGSIFLANQEMTQYESGGAYISLIMQTSDGTSLHGTGLNVTITGYLVAVSN